MESAYPSNGDRIGRLTISKEVEPRVSASGKRRRAFLCVCECGNQVTVLRTNLVKGNTNSCGCYQRDAAREAATIHGECVTKRSRAYAAWANMIARCTNKSRQGWSDYGGRGIKVCDQWRHFENFFADMGRPPDGTSIDRIDNDRDYEPSNCRWSTIVEQQRNKRTNVFIEYEGQTKTIAEWAEVLGVNYHTLRARIVRQKLPLDVAMTNSDLRFNDRVDALRSKPTDQ